MTRNRTQRGRRRNRDRAVNPDEQGVLQGEAAEQPSPEGRPAEPVQAERPAGQPERRRRRGRGGSQARQNATPVEDGVTEEQSVESPPMPERRPRPGGDGQDRRPRPAADSGDQRGRPGGDQRDDGNRRPNRRRQGRRQTIQPITGEIFKSNLRTSGVPAEPLSLRHGIEADADGLPVLGCPMLTRTRLGMPFAGGRHTPRCALGWAVHSETEAGYCMATPLVSQCWKIHPERLAELTEEPEDRAAD